MTAHQLMLAYGIGGITGVVFVLCLRIGMWLGNRWP